MAREISYRRHQAIRHMWRRLKEDRNQHYKDLSCPCWTDAKAMAKFKEQPKHTSRKWVCNPRRGHVYDNMRLTIPERKNLESFLDQMYTFVE